MRCPDAHDRNYLVGILSTAGFPATEHNIDALALLVGKMLLAGVYAPLSRAAPQMAESFLKTNQWNGRNAAKWPTLIYGYLEAMVRMERSRPVLGSGFVAHVHELPETIRAQILETADSEGFLSRPRSELLPMDWRSGE
jgi:hypothetical protein